MENQTINISPSGDTLEIRTGLAPDIHIPRDIELNGDITAPYNFHKERLHDIEAYTTHVIMNKSKRVICLVTNAGLRPQTTVTGTLDTSSHFRDFQINGSHVWSQPHELAKLFKRKKRFFSDPTHCEAIISQLKNYTATINTELEKMKDSRGNSRDIVIKKVSSNLEQFFTLIIPVFEGQESVAFKVEICVASRESGIDLWLESDELEEIMDRRINELWTVYSDEFTEAGYVIINQ